MGRIEGVLIVIRRLLRAIGPVGVVVVAGGLIWLAMTDWPTTRETSVADLFAKPGLPVPAEPQGLEGAAVKGSLAARIAIIQYSNFECRHCRAFARGSFKALAAKHLGTGQALLAFRHLPGPDRPSERSSAEAAECARRQGRFWEMHDHLFDGVPSPSRTQLSSYAGEVGLELDQFEKCMSGEAEAHVQADVAMAREIGITGAPAFLVGLLQSDGRVGVKRIMRGNHSIAVFDEIIRLLRERSTRSPEGLTGVLWGARR